MSFSDGLEKIKEYKKSDSGSKYLKIVSGIPVTLVILDDNPKLVIKHWVADGSGRRIGLRCPGQDICPICNRNREINWNREHPDYVPAQRRYRVNVLDVTPIKTCPKCGTVHNSSVSVCTTDGCGTDLTNVAVTPLNVVKILERGRRLMEQFAAFETIPHPLSGEILPLQSYPIMLVATGKGIEMNITAIQQAPTGIDYSQYDEQKFDLDAGMVLTPEEIEHILNGGIYRDILASRQAEREQVREGVSEFKKEEAEEIPF